MCLSSLGMSQINVDSPVIQVSAVGFGQRVIPTINIIREVFGSEIKTAMLCYDEEELDASKANFNCALKKEAASVDYVSDEKHSYSAEALRNLELLVEKSKMVFLIFDPEDDESCTVAMEPWASDSIESEHDGARIRIGVVEYSKRHVISDEPDLKGLFDTTVLFRSTVVGEQISAINPIVCVIKSCIDVIFHRTIICMDFADLFAIFKSKGSYAYVEVGEASEDQVDLALQRAIDNLNTWAPNWSKSKSVFVFIHADKLIGLRKIENVCSRLLDTFRDSDSMYVGCNSLGQGKNMVNVTLVTIEESPVIV